MAATMETQRLISVSLGKIAQSRGQRGGINLHKNLLVATVLHKARTAYMMESFYQQRQKLSTQGPAVQSQQQTTQTTSSPAITVPATTTHQGYVDAPTRGEVCQTSCDSNLDHQPRGTPCESAAETRWGGSSCAVSHEEPMAVLDEAHDKENAPPACDDRLSHNNNNNTNASDLSLSSSRMDESENSRQSADHLSAAAQLSHEARNAASDVNGFVSSSNNNNNVTSASPTCNVLKRRRDNPSACCQDQESDCPANKKPRVSYEALTPYYQRDNYLSDFDISSDESDSEPELGSIHSSDSPQITNLVSIFHSGFSGLCPPMSHAADSAAYDSESSGYQSDLDISGSTQFTPLSKLRPETPTPSYSRKMSEASLTCSTQVGRLESLQSAIVLSA
ncbi:hypothetical protein Btru_064288 [Bulinus truncatus]|nr:hypothetical protein Btru_064288 [Bulinus truncatus]